MIEIFYQRETIECFKKHNDNIRTSDNAQRNVRDDSIKLRGVPRYPSIEGDERCFDKPQCRIQEIAVEEECLPVRDST